MLKEPPSYISLAERIERALVVLAYFIELDGDVHLPMYEKLEGELEVVRKSQTVRERSRRRLLAHMPDGGVKAIR